MKTIFDLHGTTRTVLVITIVIAIALRSVYYLLTMRCNSSYVLLFSLVSVSLLLGNFLLMRNSATILKTPTSTKNADAKYQHISLPASSKESMDIAHEHIPLPTSSNKRSNVPNERISTPTDNAEQSPLSYDYHEHQPEYLDPRWPRRILYIWCGDVNSTFEFVHYLSLQSAIRSITPSAVMFAYVNYPESNKKVVNKSGVNAAIERDRKCSTRPILKTWLTDIEENFPFFMRQRISESDNLCPNNTTRKTEDIKHFLQRHNFLGCLYIADRTLLVEPFVLDDVHRILDYYDSTAEQGVLYVPKTEPSESAQRGKCPLLNKTIKFPMFVSS